MIAAKTTLEDYFASFRKNITGSRQLFNTPFGKKQVLYADWTASGRAYSPIETCIQQQVLPFVGNTHTETTITGTLMSNAYETARSIIKQHTGAGSNDILIFCGSGMTAAVNKLQRILGLRIPERMKDYLEKTYQAPAFEEALKPVVFITHMEHHSNQTSWLETIATVEIIEPAGDGGIDMHHFRTLLEKYKHRQNKIAAVTACSNVTGIQTPYREIAKTIHQYGGLCFVDFACSAPYTDIHMHPGEKDAHLDAIYFSGHKFLGGPGTPGVLIFDKKIYTNSIPDQPGGGTILYSNPWKVHEYVADIEQREDGGTPPFLQAIKLAMCIRLKEEMGVENMLAREGEILPVIFNRLAAIKNIEVLEGNYQKRLGVVSFIVQGTHHNLVVKMLNDRFGIQARGGCSCAGTYGHRLLHVGRARSAEILNRIRAGNLLCKPGWIRISIHPTMTNAAVDFMMEAIDTTARRFPEWQKDYCYDAASNQYLCSSANRDQPLTDAWFTVSAW